MREAVNQEVSVVMYYSARQKRAVPHLLNWQNRDYALGSVDYYHSYMEGRDKQHVFELTDTDNSMHFRLRLDSGNLHWTLEATHNGMAY